jgi:hypothetical protein
MNHIDFFLLVVLNLSTQAKQRATCTEPNFFVKCHSWFVHVRDVCLRPPILAEQLQLWYYAQALKI